MKIRKILSSILAVLMTASCLSVVSFASGTESTETVTPIQIAITDSGANDQRCTRIDGVIETFGRTVQQIIPDNSKKTTSMAPASFIKALDATEESLVRTAPTKYKAIKVVYYVSGTTAKTPTLTVYGNTPEATGSGTMKSFASGTAVDTGVTAAGKWNVAYFEYGSDFATKYVDENENPIVYTPWAFMFAPYGDDSVSDHMGETIYIGYMGLFDTVANAKAHTSEFEGTFNITSAKAGTAELTIENGVAAYDLAGASAVPELVITATGDTSNVTIENAKLTAASDGKATSYVKNGDDIILTVNFTGGEYKPVEPAALTAAAAASDTDYAGIENYRVQSGSLVDDFGRTINTYKPLWYYFTGDGENTSDNYFIGNLRANVEVPATVTRENYKTVKLVYRSTSTEVPTLSSGTTTVPATDSSATSANVWNTLYYDYTSLSAADSFIINFTEGTDPNEYKEETWEIGYLGLMENAAAAQAHTSAFEGEFTVTDVLLGGTSIGNVTTYEMALNGAKDVPALTVKATGDTSKVTITNGVIDGEGKATSTVKNDGTDVVTVSFTGGDTTFRVTDILVDGVSIGNFDANTKEYTFDRSYGSGDPVVEYEFAGAGEALDIETTESEIDGNGLVSQYTVTIKDGGTVLYTLVFNVDTSLDSRLVNSLYRLQVDKELNVSYFGGSVTNGFYSGFVTDWLKENYGEESTVGATINAVQSSIGGSGSMFAVHRLKEHVVEYMATQVPADAKSKLPDLIFIECAINDVGGYDVVYKADGTKLAIADSNQQYINAESMVRQLYAINPKIDIIFVITGDYSRLKDDFTSDTPVFGTAYTELAKHYDIPIMYVGRELVRDNFETYPASAKDEAWTKFIKSDGVHPTEAGGKDYADTITAYLAEDLPKTFTPAAKDYAAKTLPETVYCTVNSKGDLIVDAGLVDIEKVESTKLGGWTVGAAETYGLNYPLLSSAAGDVFSFETNASNVWLWLHAKSTETELVWTIDGGEPKSWKFSMKNPNNYALQLAEGLDNTETHTIRLYHSDANPVDIRSIMLSGMPEGTADATITPVPYFDMTTETYTVKVGGAEFADFDPAVKEYEIGVDTLGEDEGYPEIAFDCRDTYYGCTISQADLAAGDNSAELTIDNVGTYTFSFTIGDAVEVDSIVKESGYKSGDAKAVLKEAAEYPVQLKSVDAGWTDADAITTYPAGTSELTGLTAGEYTYRYVVEEGSYGTAKSFRIWNTYPTENVYYVSDNGTGDGSSPEKAASAGGTIKSVIDAAATYFKTKLGESNLANATCYIALVGDVTHGANVTGLTVFCKELVITGEYGSNFNMKKRLAHKLVSENAGKLIWRDVPVILGDASSTGAEIYYGMMGNEVEFDNFYLKSFAAGCSSKIELLVFAPSAIPETPVPGKLMTIDPENSPFASIRYSNFNGAFLDGYVNLEYNSGKVGNVALGGRGGTSGSSVFVSDYNTVSKINVNGGEITNLYISGSNKYGISYGTLAAIINGGTVTSVKVVENGQFTKDAYYDSNGNAWVDDTSTGSKFKFGYETTNTTEADTDRVLIFNNGTSAASVEKKNIDYIINSAVGGSVDITTSTETDNLYRLTGFTFTTNRQYVEIKQGEEVVKTLTVNDGKASVTTADLAAGEYSVSYKNPEGVATISASIKLGRAANKAAAANNGLKLEIRKEDGTVLRTIALEDTNTVTDEDGCIAVELQTNVADITDESITIVAVKNGYAPCSKTTTNANLVSDLEAFVEELADSLVNGHGDIKGDFEASCGDGKVDFDDFVRVLRGFNKPDAGSAEYADYEKYMNAVDLNEDGVINVKDLQIVKDNFGYGTNN